MRQRGFRRIEPHFPRWVWCLRGHFVCVGGELAWPHEGQNLWLCWKVLGVRTHPKPLHPALLRSNVRKGDRIHSEVCAAAVINLESRWLALQSTDAFEGHQSAQELFWHTGVTLLGHRSSSCLLCRGSLVHRHSLGTNTRCSPSQAG